MKYNQFVYGKNQWEAITGVELDSDTNTINVYQGQAVKPSKQVPMEYWILYTERINNNCQILEGGLHYQWGEKFTDIKEYQKAKGIARAKGVDYYTAYNPVEAYMIKSGVTYYKGMEPKDISILSFDIETTGLDPASSKLLLISNTFRDAEGNLTRTLFSYEDYKSEKEMIYAWCNYVCDLNPNIILGHNILGFDLPYLKFKSGTLPLGRMRKQATFARYVSQFRKDGSQSYDYTNVIVPGREIIDTFHLAIKFDTGRRYPSYGLKPIIAYEGLERLNRTHWDFDKVSPQDIYKASENGDMEQWEAFKDYCRDDADDALALFDLMIPAYFYYCQHIPKTMQQVINSASGSQVNSFMIRAYISEGHSIPKADETYHFEGGLVDATPGIFTNVYKVDVASLYPSIILTHKICNEQKDPKKYFLKMVEYFTTERLSNKKLANQTGERSYSDLEQAQKIIINSAYGFLGAPGLNFNSPKHAEVVTGHGRDILKKGIHWSESMGYKTINADTDSYSFAPGYKMTDAEFADYIDRLNSQFESGILWEDDGIYDNFIVVKRKNYILKNARNGKLTIKGSGLKATMKEPALKEFIRELIDCILEDKEDAISDIYMDYARMCCSVDMDTIAKWCSKKTITKAVLTGDGTAQRRIRDAIKSSAQSVQEGDKIYIYFKSDTEYALRETFDGTYSAKKLLGKLFKTAEIFKPILSMDKFPNLTLKRNQGLLGELNG